MAVLDELALLRMKLDGLDQAITVCFEERVNCLNRLPLAKRLQPILVSAPSGIPHPLWQLVCQSTAEASLVYDKSSAVINSASSLNALKDELVAIDNGLAYLLLLRLKLSIKVGRYKQRRAMPVLDLSRWDKAVARKLDQAKALNLPIAGLAKFWGFVHQQSCTVQKDIAAYSDYFLT